MRILDLIWSPSVVDKLEWKHGVAPEEVESVLFGRPRYRKIQKGHIPGEDLYAAFGQTQSGRYLTIFLVYKTNRQAFIVSARDMDGKERKRYEREKNP